MSVTTDYALLVNLLSTSGRADPSTAVLVNSIASALNVSGTSTGDSSIFSSSDVSTGSGNQTDTRIRLGYLDSAVDYPGILAPLANTNGLLFPYTPAISISQDVDYASMNMTHANTNYYSYSHTTNTNISITGKFTIQNQQEGLYALAAIHFLRSVTKMYFGEQDATSGKAGLPPPILQLNGYGTYMFNKLRVFVKSYSMSFDENMDTVEINAGNGNIRLPPVFSLQVPLVVQNTSRAQRKDFSLDQFKSGALLESPPNNSGWI